MQFKLLSIATAVLAASSAQAQLSANDVVKNIGEITELSSSTADIAKSIDSPISVFSTAPVRPTSLNLNSWIDRLL